MIAWSLWAYWTVLALVACPYEDTVRDVVAALDVADGSHWPSAGPGLAFAAHLGPAWFYLLAPIAALSHSWLGVALFIAALAALKFPLAFRFGSAVGGSRFGVFWALALLLPGWQHLQSMLATHTSLVETTALACLLAIRAYLGRPREWRAFVVGLTFALALHAHPTTVALLPLGLIAAWRYGAPSVWRPACLLAAVLGALLPFAPYLAAQASNGWPDAATASGYVAQSITARQLAQLPALIGALLWGGPHTLIDALAPRGARAVLFELWAAPLVVTSAAVAILWSRLAPAARSLIARTLFAWIVTLCTLCILRERVPWYMTYAPTLACAALLAACWDAMASVAGRGATAAFAAAFLIAGVGVALDVGLWRASGRGEFLLPGGAMHDTLVGYEPAPPIPIVGGTSLPARFAAASGRFLCAHRDAVLHASYGGYVDATAAIDERMMCGASQVLQIGAGAASALDRHWIGLPWRLWHALDRQPQLWIGPFGLAPAARVSANAMTLPVSTADRYPQRDLLPAGNAAFTLELDLPAGAPLVTSVVLGPVGPATIDEVRANGDVQNAVATTAFVAVYNCTNCKVGENVDWQVRFRAARRDLVDVAGIAAPD